MHLLELFKKIHDVKVQKYNLAQFFRLQRSSLVLKSSSVGCGIAQKVWRSSKVCSRSIAHYFFY
jgi:hypothetical protein